MSRRYIYFKRYLFRLLGILNKENVGEHILFIEYEIIKAISFFFIYELDFD